jgi:hypothetical protein
MFWTAVLLEVWPYFVNKIDKKVAIVSDHFFFSNDTLKFYDKYRKFGAFIKFEFFKSLFCSLTENFCGFKNMNL